MKLMSVTVPILIVSLTVISVWGIGMLAVRASAVSTQASIDLLRTHLRVARLHEQLLRHSREAVAAHAETLLPSGAAAAGAGDETPEDSTSPGMSQPWPEGVAESLGSVSTLEQGLRQAKPALNRLVRRLDSALPSR